MGAAPEWRVFIPKRSMPWPLGTLHAGWGRTPDHLDLLHDSHARLPGLFGANVPPEFTFPPLLTHTAGNVRYGHLGGGSDAPSPTLFVFAGSLEDSPDSSDLQPLLLAVEGARIPMCFPRPARPRSRRPARGAEGTEGLESSCSAGRTIPWPTSPTGRARFWMRLSKKGWPTPGGSWRRGTSRGGFAALHLAAADSRVGSAAALAPVTDLAALREFQGLGGRSLDPVSRLGGKSRSVGGPGSLDHHR